MKNLVKIIFVVFFTFSLTSCAIFSKAELRAGYDQALENIKNNINQHLDNPNTDAFTKNATNALVENTEIGSSNKSGYYIGFALSDIPLTTKLKLQPEINFVGIKDFNQIQTPVLLNYSITDKFNLYTGPNFEFLLDAPQNIKSFNFALDLGASYDISDNFLIEARYDWGQTNLLENANSDNYFKMSHFQVGIAYIFGSKK